MTITIRLPTEVEADLRTRLDASGTALSQFVREAIAEKLRRDPADQGSAYEIGKHLFGRYGSGRHDLSTNRKAILDQILQIKHPRRRRTTHRIVRSG